MYQNAYHLMHFDASQNAYLVNKQSNTLQNCLISKNINMSLAKVTNILIIQKCLILKNDI